MITFSKNSWHYKFNDFLEYKEVPWATATDCKSLCAYFWSTVWNMAWTLILMSVVWLIFTLLGAVLLEKFATVSPLSEDWVQLLWVWVVGFLGVVLGLGGIFLFARCVVLPWVFVKENTGKIFNAENNIDKQPNIFVEWVKAKKAKVCPMIEFKE